MIQSKSGPLDQPVDEWKLSGAIILNGLGLAKMSVLTQFAVTSKVNRLAGPLDQSNLRPVSKGHSHVSGCGPLDQPYKVVNQWSLEMEAT